MNCTNYQYHTSDGRCIYTCDCPYKQQFYEKESLICELSILLTDEDEMSNDELLFSIESYLKNYKSLNLIYT